MQTYRENQMLKHCPYENSFSFCQYSLWNKLYKNTSYFFPARASLKTKYTARGIS